MRSGDVSGAAFDEAVAGGDVVDSRRGGGGSGMSLIWTTSTGANANTSRGEGRSVADVMDQIAAAPMRMTCTANEINVEMRGMGASLFVESSTPCASGSSAPPQFSVAIA